MGVCCVDGCNGVPKDIVYFEFPARRSLRRKWSDVLNIGSKVAIGTVVCSQHFHRDDYEVVRGKVRLKSKVVPTLLLTNKSQDVKIIDEMPLQPVKENSVLLDEISTEKTPLPPVKDNSVLPDEKSTEGTPLQPVKENSVLPDEKNTNKTPLQPVGENSVLPDEKITNKTPLQPVGENSVLPDEKITNKSPLQPVEENSVLPKEKIIESSEIPQPDSTTGNIIELSKHDRKERRRELKAKRKKKSMEICKVVTKDSTEHSRNCVDRDSLQPDPKQQPDFEDMITNYQIKNSKPNSLLPQQIEIEVPPACPREEAIVLDDREDAPPVFIEIAVDKDNNTSNAGNEDCLMVLESVQVDIDPSSLMLPERDEDEEPHRDAAEEEKAPVKRKEPVSLLTSSDEDDVIIQEPHIDTVDVSDETDEDDMPLVKLVKKKPSKDKSATKKAKQATVKNLFWNRMYDFYCMQCNFTTMDSLTYNNHLKDHHKVLQVCTMCSFTTSSKTEFAKHLRKHERFYNCHLCSFSATQNTALVYHLQCHKVGDYIQKVKNGYKCKKCGFFSEHRKVVSNHARACGSNAKMYPCDQCEHIALRKNEFDRHWRTRHQASVIEVHSDSSVE